MKSLAEKHGTENLIIVLGINQPSVLRIMTKTFRNGDPSFSGPLAGIPLGLKSYHILELMEQVPAEVWKTEMGMYELEIEEEVQTAIFQAMKEARQS